MNGEHAETSRCPICGGRMSAGLATVPFVLKDAVVVLKEVPAEVCQRCREPFMNGRVIDRITALLAQICAFRAEVLVLTYTEGQPTAVMA